MIRTVTALMFGLSVIGCFVLEFFFENVHARYAAVRTYSPDMATRLSAYAATRRSARGPAVMKEPKPFAAPKPRLEAGMRTATGAKIQQMESVPYELETDIEHRTQGFVDSLTDNIARIEDLYDRAKAEKYLKQLEDQVSNLAEQDRLSYRLRSWASNQIAAARTRISKGHKAAEGMSEEEQATP